MLQSSLKKVSFGGVRWRGIEKSCGALEETQHSSINNANWVLLLGDWEKKIGELKNTAIYLQGKTTTIQIVGE